MNKTWQKVSLVSFALTTSLSFSAVYAQVQAAPAIYNTSVQSTTTNLGQAVNNVLNAYVAKGDFSGVVMLVKHGAVLYEKGYGYANAANQTPNTPQTRFAIGALSQSFTAAAVLQLVEKGKMNLNDPIGKYLPSLPTSVQSITVSQLLTQTSGAPANTSQAPVAPGSEYRYSELNYLVLGQIIQAVTGQNVQTYIQQNILTPLGMTNTGFITKMSQVPNSAVGYTLNSQNQVVPYDFQPTSAQMSTDGLYSTVGDLLKWDQALYNGNIVSRQLIQEMFTPTSISIKTLKTLGYGFGWGVTTDGQSAISESVINGYDSFMFRNMGHDETIVLLSNRQWAPLPQIAQQLQPILDQAPLSVPNIPSQVTGQKQITFNGTVFSSPYSRVAMGTTYMPIWYIGKALEKLGIKQTWDATNRTWSLTLPQGMQTDFSNIMVGSGNTDIMINGQLVKRINTYAWLDPSTGYKSYTVYAPIYYLQQILTAAGVHNTWNGHAWAVTTN